jgi:hypothetical protein
MCGRSDNPASAAALRQPHIGFKVRVLPVRLDETIAALLGNVTRRFD